MEANRCRRTNKQGSHESPERLLPRTAQTTHEIDDQHDQQHEAQRASSDDGASEVEAAATEEKKQEEND